MQEKLLRVWPRRDHIVELRNECTSHLRYKTDQGPALHGTWDPYGS
jgi:hypothetical protein